MPTLQPITLYGSAGPNPPKVAMILEELSLPYTIQSVPFHDVKNPPYTTINPNGRLPAIHDPNTNLTLWESGAIIEYLISRYDTTHKLSFPPGSNDSYLTKQWLYFQASGQGPYYGQAVWFVKFHAEQVPSARERYVNEIKRVCGVVEGWLAKQKEVYGEGDGPWLVGGRITYADVAWLQWQRVVGMAIPKGEFDQDAYPLVSQWVGKIAGREAVVRALKRSEEATGK